MKKQLSAIFAATIFAFAIAGCGTETRSDDGGGYYPVPTPTPTVSPTPTPSPTVSPTPTPTPTQDVDTSVKTVYYKATGGNVTDVCTDDNHNFYFNVSAGTSSSIMKYDQNKDEVTTVVTGLTKPFSVAYVGPATNTINIDNIDTDNTDTLSKAEDDDEHLYYTTREGSAGHVWDYNITKKTTTPYEPAKEGINLIDPTYLHEYNGVVAGIDRSNTSRFGFVLDDRTHTYATSPGSSVLTAANFFDGFIYMIAPEGSAVYRYFITGSLSATGGIGVLGWTDQGIKEITETSEVAPYCSHSTTGKFITHVSEFQGKVIYSSHENGTLRIYTYNPTGSDEVLVSDGNIPAAYDITVSRVNPDKFYFTACSTSTSQGVYVYDSTTKKAEKIAGSTTDQPMISPARIMLTGKEGLPNGYEEIIWTCGGGAFDTSKGQFEGASGAVYTKVHLIGVPEVE